MRNENQKPKKEDRKQTISNDRSKKKHDQHHTTGSGLIGEHDLGDAVERNIDRNTHTKSSVSGSDTDGQAV